MNYRRLGRSGLEVSVIAIGTNQLRRVPERQAIETLKRAFALGVNLVNVEPEYEGAYDLIVSALAECDRPERVHLSIQAGGPDGAYLERIFEDACAKFGRERIDLFGITSISDQEAFGADVWGSAGLVDFLLRKKAEGRVRGIYASDHGSPEQTMALLERDVFDALMLAHNPLGFHLHTVRGKTVWQFETPPVPIERYETEDLARTGRELLPLARRRDVGVMVMKPLAGGLLCTGKAFPQHRWRDEMPEPPPARDILRYLLADEAVTCVVPGMASVEEVEENVSAGCGDIGLDPERTRHVETRTAALTKVLCSRCGQCDDLCSQGLPISYLFRAAYHYLYPSATFAISSALQYFRLYPREECVCDTCPAQTCRCPFGIDIPREMKAIHRKMIELRDRGLVPAGDRLPEDWATGRERSFKVLAREIPPSLGPGEAATVRVHVRNTGTRAWHREDGQDCAQVALAVHLGDRPVRSVRLRQDVAPSQDCHFAFEVNAPRRPGVYDLWMDLRDARGGLFSQGSPPPVRQAVSVAAAPWTRWIPGWTRRAPCGAPEVVGEGSARGRRLIARALSALGLLETARRVRHAWLSPAAAPAPVAAPRGAGPAEPRTTTEEERFAARYLEHNVPAECVAGTRCVFRIEVENSGSAPWRPHPPDGHGVALALFIDDEFAGAGAPSRDPVAPGERVVIVVSTQLPGKVGDRRFRFEMLVSDRLWFKDHGSPPLEMSVRLADAPRTETEALLDTAGRRNSWYYSPGQGVHRSRGRPLYPVFAESTRGATLTDVDGRLYVDLLMGWGSCLLGYGEPRIQAAIARAVATTAGVVSLPHRLEMEVSERLCADYPWGDQVLFGKNGSDATTWAVRAARVATGRQTILYAGYHGWQDWSVGHLGFADTGVPADAARHAVSLPYGDVAALEQAVAVHAAELAAIMIEPAHVCLDPADTGQSGDGPYLRRAEALARRHGALFVLDEIMTAFRFRGGSAQADFGLTADLTCLGKALANGMPLSALVARGDRLRQVISRIVYAPTMKGEVYSFAAALEALRIYRDEDVSGEVWAIGERLRRGVSELCRRLGLDATLVGPPYRMNLLFGSLPVDGDDDIRRRTLLQQELARHGVLSHRGYVIPSRAHDDEAIDRCLAGFAGALTTLRDVIASGAWSTHLDVPDLGAEERRRTATAPAPRRVP